MRIAAITDMTARLHARTVARRSELGATAVEYGLLVAFIAAVIIGTVVTLGGSVTGLYNRVHWW